MKISVVIPCFNGEKFLDEAIASINSQTMAVYQIVIVNDGSTDNSKAIIDAYVSSSTTPIIALHQQNGGVSAARNTGLAMATGDWVAFLDVDDLWYPNKLEEQASIASEHGETLGMVCSDYNIDYLPEGTSKYSTCQFVRPLLGRPIATEEFQKAFIQENFIGTATAMLFKRELALRIGGFDVCLNHSEDFDFILRFSLFADIYLVANPLAMKRHHGANLTGDLALYYYSHACSLKKNFSLYSNGSHYFRNNYSTEIIQLMRLSYDDFMTKFCNEIYERNSMSGLLTYCKSFFSIITLSGCKQRVIGFIKKIIRTITFHHIKK
jgi:glycosyltransferase involved in cell wall biosynthesis